jgi:ribosome-associated toxin RatA of RatAB toxin-antitoxin module
MAGTTQEIVIAAPPERVFDVIADYQRYPEFVPAVRSCRPRRQGSVVEVDFEVDLGVKRIHYTLRHVEERPRTVSWSLVASDWMKLSNGAWRLEPQPGDRTRALYTVEVQIAKPPLIPQKLVDRVTDELTRVQLPRTLAAFKQRAEQA